MSDMPESYVPLVTVERHNGAYLIIMARNEITEDWGYIELVNCASSITRAKQVAVRMAEEVTADGSGHRWENETGGGWVLYGRLDDPGDY